MEIRYHHGGKIEATWSICRLHLSRQCCWLLKQGCALMKLQLFLPVSITNLFPSLPTWITIPGGCVGVLMVIHNHFWPCQKSQLCVQGDSMPVTLMTRLAPCTLEVTLN